jgi:hypothetical protein
MTLQTPVPRQQIPKRHQWTNWEEMFSAWSLRQLHDATIELLDGVFTCETVAGQ